MKLRSSEDKKKFRTKIDKKGREEHTKIWEWDD